jgi:hypothetical protein
MGEIGAANRNPHEYWSPSKFMFYGSSTKVARMFSRSALKWLCKSSAKVAQEIEVKSTPKVLQKLHT